MAYDLDCPPVVIRSSRWKMVLLLTVCAGFAAMGWLATRDPGAAPAIGYGVMIFFGLGVLVALWRMVQPAWLELAPAGLRWFAGWKIEHFAWRDFQSFEVYAPSLFSRHIGYILAPNSANRTYAAKAVRGISGFNGGFGGGWGLSATRLVDLLNRAQAKWSGG